jgi:hypothetical protein
LRCFRKNRLPYIDQTTICVGTQAARPQRLTTSFLLNKQLTSKKLKMNEEQEKKFRMQVMHMLFDEVKFPYLEKFIEDRIEPFYSSWIDTSHCLSRCLEYASNYNEKLFSEEEIKKAVAMYEELTKEQWGAKGKERIELVIRRGLEMRRGVLDYESEIAKVDECLVSLFNNLSKINTQIVRCESIAKAEAKAKKEKRKHLIIGSLCGGIGVYCIFAIINIFIGGLSFVGFLKILAFGFLGWFCLENVIKAVKKVKDIKKESELRKRELDELFLADPQLLRQQRHALIATEENEKQMKQSELEQKRRTLSDEFQKSWNPSFGFVGRFCLEKVKDLLHKRDLDERFLADPQLWQQRHALLEQKRRTLLDEFQKSWNPSLQPLKNMAAEIQRFQPPLHSLSENSLSESTGVQEKLVSGLVRLTSPLFSLIFNKDWTLTIPHMLGFPIAKPIFDAYKEEYNRATDASPLHKLLLRLLFTLPAGMLEIISIDPLQKGRSLAPFLPLTDIEEIVPQKRFLTRQDEIESVLHQLSEYMDDLMQKHFIGSTTDWQTYNKKNPDNKLPYKVLFIFGFPEQFTDKSISYLKGIISNGTLCGILPIITLDYSKINSLSQYEGKNITEIDALLEKNGVRIHELYSTNYHVLGQLIITTEYEPFPEHNHFVQYLEWVKNAYRKHRESKKFNATIEDIWSEKPFALSSIDGISTPLGWTANGQEVPFELGDAPPHALLAGGTGSGKSNLIHVLIHGLLNRYSPDELNLYLLDYKEGTEFNVYAGNAAPQIKLVSIESDAEYGVTVLEHLNEELKRRANLFKKVNAKDIAAYRKTTGEKLPRVLLIVDEFYVQFQASSETAGKGTKLFTNIFKQGRSFGVHVLLATQSLAGMSEFINPFLSQLGCRIALSCSTEDSERILSLENSEAAHLIKRKEAILNNQNGVKSANRKFDVPHAKNELCLKHLRKIAAVTKKAGYKTDTKIYKGSFLPEIPVYDWFRSYAGQIVLGEQLNFAAAPFAFQWEHRRGNNLCVAGIDNAIRHGILLSVLNSVINNFNRIVYYNSAPQDNQFDPSEFFDVEIKDSTWDCDISEWTADLQNQRTLLIIDSLDNADTFYKNEYGSLKFTDTLTTLLDKGPLHGSFVLTFVDNWSRFAKLCNDFNIRIGFNLEEHAAGSFVKSEGYSFKGLENPNKAVFINRQRNLQTMFRPFVLTKNSDK